MALIKQIKVGGTTYNIGINADAPLIASGDNLSLNIGSGLHEADGQLAVRVHSGLMADNNGLSLCISGASENFSRGLAFERGMLKLKLGSGLKFNSEGAIDLA